QSAHSARARGWISRMTDIVSGGEVISVDDSLNQYKRNCTENAEEPYGDPCKVNRVNGLTRRSAA
ncbi:hypothetical protein, partial [Limobrevibacterium gyesilva]